MQFPAIEIATLLTSVVARCCMVGTVVMMAYCEWERGNLSTGSEMRLVVVVKCTSTIKYPYRSVDSSTCMRE
jgi:hypothetical protein